MAAISRACSPGLRTAALTVIGRYVDEWILSIEELTERVRKSRELLDAGRAGQATRLLPHEAVYPVPAWLMRQLGM